MGTISLSEIARHSGVDVSTVSRALISRSGVRTRGLITGRSQTTGGAKVLPADAIGMCEV